MPSESYLSPAEIEAVQSLHKRSPYIIRHVSSSMFSVARHYGGAKYNGSSYTYQPLTDELIRDDVLKRVVALRKESDDE